MRVLSSTGPETPHEPYGNSFSATMSDKFIITKMNPQKIHYTWASFPHHFRCGRSVGDTMQRLKSGVLRASDIPEIRVFQWNGKWYTWNNRRLWCFKMAGLRSVPVISMDEVQVDPWKFTTAKGAPGAPLVGSNPPSHLPLLSNVGPGMNPQDQSAITGHEVFFGYQFFWAVECDGNCQPHEPYGNFELCYYVTMSSKFGKTKMSPEQIRFTQDSIANRFQCGRSVPDTMRRLKSGVLRASDIPEIRVFQWNGRWHTEDNRRLWCFKMAGLSSVPVRCIDEMEVDPRKFTTKNFGVSVRMR